MYFNILKIKLIRLKKNLNKFQLNWWIRQYGWIRKWKTINLKWTIKYRCTFESWP